MLCLCGHKRSNHNPSQFGSACCVIECNCIKFEARCEKTKSKDSEAGSNSLGGEVRDILER